MNAYDRFGVSQSFRDRADSAAFYEAWVGSVLARAGLYTLHYPFEIDGKDHGLSFDMTVSNEAWDDIDGHTHLIPFDVEVKSLSVPFTDVSSYPFNEVLVCSQNNFLRKWPGTDVVGRHFLFVSKPTGSIIWLPKGSKVTLGHDQLDRTRNEVYKVVKCTKGQLCPLQDFVELVKA